MTDETTEQPERPTDEHPFYEPGGHSPMRLNHRKAIEAVLVEPTEISEGAPATSDHAVEAQP